MIAPPVVNLSLSFYCHVQKEGLCIDIAASGTQDSDKMICMALSVSDS